MRVFGGQHLFLALGECAFGYLVCHPRVVILQVGC